MMTHEQMKPSKVARRGKPAQALRPRLVAADGERINDEPITDSVSRRQCREDRPAAGPDPDPLTVEEDDQQPEESAGEPDGLDVSKVVVDRDELRGLRESEAAEAVAAAAKGAEAVADLDLRKNGAKRIIHAINPYDLEFEAGHNPREFTSLAMRERVVDLARSIAVRGVRQALDVYIKGNKLYVNGGETRWRATMHALNFLNVKVERVPAVISMGENDLDRVIDQWIGNDQLQFDPLEAGKLFRKALDFQGVTPAEIARRIGKSTAYVTERLKLLEMPEWLKERVRDGTIAADNAYTSIWQAAGEDDTEARKLLSAAVDMANEAGARRVMPKHIRKAGGRRTAATVAGMVSDLAAILRRHDRAELEAALGAEDVARLFKLAKL